MCVRVPRCPWGWVGSWGVLGLAGKGGKGGQDDEGQGWGVARGVGEGWANVRRVPGENTNMI